MIETAWAWRCATCKKLVHWRDVHVVNSHMVDGELCGPLELVELRPDEISD